MPEQRLPILMKPYKVNTTYLNLDDVQGLKERPATSDGHGNWHGEVYMAFHSEPLKVPLGWETVDRPEPWSCPPAVRATWEAFLKAWKERDGMAFGSGPQPLARVGPNETP